MEKQISRILRRIEKTHNVRILLAAESGSRAWGFASPDSDYDVRFIYVRPPEEYLRLESVRDVIELPISDSLDINGWDLQKALRLLHNSNPTLFEWFSSPVVYLETEFANEFRKIMNEYFMKKRSLYHYISMAEKNYREYLKTEIVKVKKYFYVLRPVLACRWILEKGTPPPMQFSVLAAAELPNELTEDVSGLLDTKMNAPEIREISKIERINDYLGSSIAEIKDTLGGMTKEETVDWSGLNRLFLTAF